MSLSNRLRSSAGRIVLALHGVGAGAWLWFMAGGFPATHPRFFLNRVLPAALVAATLAAALEVRWRPRIVLGLAAAWAGIGIAAALVFPVSLAGIWAIPLPAALALVWVSRGDPAARPALSRLDAGAAVLGLVLGGSLLVLERPPRPTTRPAMTLASHHALVEPPFVETLTPIECGPLSVSVDPFLELGDVAPDGAWSLFASRLHAGADTLRSMSVRRDGATGATLISAATVLRQATYAHLATFTRFRVEGHAHLTVRFSAAPGIDIDVLPSDYPTGRPARAAFVDDGGDLHVVEASSGEKGPFHALADGHLGRGAPLAITLADAGRPVCKLTVADWANQSSTDLSPTAGWRVPQNAIELDRLGDADTAPVAISFTLAATSMGRGWDMVGHRQGVYRNRIAVEPLTR